MNTREQFLKLFNQNKGLFTQNAINTINGVGLIEHCCQGGLVAGWDDTPVYILEAIIDLIQKDSKTLKAYKYRIDGWASYILGYGEDTEQELFTVTLVSDKGSVFDQIQLVQEIKSNYLHAPNLLNSRVDSVTFFIYQ